MREAYVYISYLGGPRVAIRLFSLNCIDRFFTNNVPENTYSPLGLPTI